MGYRFEEINKLRHINREAIDFYGVPHYLINGIKEGNDLVLPDGTVIDNERLTTAPAPPASYAYCSDTAFNPAVAESVAGTDTLYHEATYGDEGAVKAAPRGHSTARQAAKIAQAANARRLILGHYSKTVLDESILAAEAAEHFNGEIIAAKEGLVIDLA